MLLRTPVNYLVEFFGTFGLMYSVLASNGNPIFVGLTLIVLILIFAPISKTVLNPALSIAFYVNKKLSLKDLVIYTVMQILGALAALHMYSRL